MHLEAVALWRPFEIFRLRRFIWEFLLGIFRLGTLWFDSDRLGTFAFNHLGVPALDLSLQTCRLESFAWNLEIRSFRLRAFS